MIPITMASNSISTITSISHWCNIHDDLLDLVLARLSFLDKLRIRGVCTSWRSITKAYISNLFKLSPSTQCPLLMHPVHRECSFERFKMMFRNNTFSSKIDIQDSRARGMLMLEDNKFRKVKNIPVDIEKSLCIGSSQGWLVFSDEKYSRYRIRILNPFVDVCITLCYLPKLPSVTKVIFWSDPILSGCKYAIVALHKAEYTSRVAYAMCGDDKWRFLKGQISRSSDIVCFNNLVYVLGESGTIEAWDFNNYEPSKTTTINPYFPPESTGEFDEAYQIPIPTKLHLVCSHDELLMVEQYCTRFSYKTKNFKVYSLDKETKKWVKRDNLGNMLLILGGNHSAIVAAKDIQAYKENSIYFNFINDNWVVRNLEDQCSRNIGVFDLDEGSVEWITGNVMDVKRFQPPFSFWIVRNFD